MGELKRSVKSWTECFRKTNCATPFFLCSRTSRICHMPCLQQRSQTSSRCTSSGHAHGISKQHAPPQEMVCTKAWIGSQILSAKSKRDSQQQRTNLHQSTDSAILAAHINCMHTGCFLTIWPWVRGVIQQCTWYDIRRYVR